MPAANTASPATVTSVPADFSALSVDQQISVLGGVVTALSDRLAEVEARPLPTAEIPPEISDKIEAASTGVARLTRHIFGE